MRVLVACEESQEVTKAFRARGHEAYSCDILPCSGGHPEWHFKSDVKNFLEGTGWDLIIAHPPCTYLTIAAEWAYKDPDYIRYPGVGYHQKLKPETLFGADRRQEREYAIKFVRDIINSPAKMKVIENPIGVLTTKTNILDTFEMQLIQPYEFGEDASKATCLFIQGLPKLKPTKYIEPRIVNGMKRWANQTDTGQNRLGPSEKRAKERSKTYPGIARAMAEQWG